MPAAYHAVVVLQKLVAGGRIAMDYRDDVATVFPLGRQSRHDSAVPFMTEGHGLQMRRRILPTPHTEKRQCALLCSLLLWSQAVMLARHLPAQRRRSDERNEVEISAIV